jgi:hypothetical protein
MRRGPKHLQCSDQGSAVCTDRLIREASSWPHVDYTASAADGLQGSSFYVNENVMTSDPSAYISPREFGRLLRTGPTVYLAMRLADAHWAIVRGWAEPHYLARMGMIPAGVMVVYTPRDEGELRVCLALFRASYRFACIEPSA